MKKHYLFLTLFLICSLAYGQTRDRLIERESIFRGEAVIDTTSTAWHTIGSFTLPPQVLANHNQSNFKLRMRFVYTITENSTVFFVQTRLGFAGEQPSFLLGQDDGRRGGRSVFSNWVMLENFNLPPNGIIPLALNLRGQDGGDPPRITLQLVEVEIWEELPIGIQPSNLFLIEDEAILQPVVTLLGANFSYSDNDNRLQPAGTIPHIQQQPTPQSSVAPNTVQSQPVQIASAPSLNPLSSLTAPNQQREQDNTERALQAGLTFLRAAAIGDFRTAEAMLANEVVSLSDFSVINRSEIPFFRLAANQNFATYLSNYEQHIFAFADFAGLFDAWERYDINGWQVSANSYLFMGNQLRTTGSDVFAGQSLVFIIEEIDGVMRIRAFP
ncbi:MAG: hypothetical protein FWE37_07375 [Spirochaetaceae bacterium]|nr:hypothetical protein [Spirochaetaceae bacterium]